MKMWVTRRSSWKMSKKAKGHANEIWAQEIQLDGCRIRSIPPCHLDRFKKLEVRPPSEPQRHIYS